MTPISGGDDDRDAGGLVRRLVRAVLERGLGASEDALGDLEEEFARRRRGGSRARRLRDAAWYLREGMSLSVALLRERWSGGRTAPGNHSNGRGREMAGDILKELVIGLRRLARRPAGSVALMATIALAVGASTAIFALVSAAWLRPLPYPAGERLVRVHSAYGEPANHTAVSPPTWRDLVEHPEVLEAVGVWSVGETVHLSGDGDPVRLIAPRASTGLFELAGLPPALGRLFRSGDEVPGADDVVVLSHGFWTRHFGADPEILGRRLLLDARSFEVVGVADPAMALPGDADLWRPLALGVEWFAPGRRGWEFLRAVGRLAPGVSTDEATRRLTARFAEAEPDRADRLEQGLAAVPFRTDFLGQAGSVVLYLLLAVGLLLAMAVVNVTAVLLARSEERSREYQTRRALGAGAGPVVRSVLAEALGLSLAGGAAGLLLATLGLRAAARLELGAVGALGEATLDVRVLAFALGVMGVATMAFAAGPALRALRTDPAGALRAGGRGHHGGRATVRLRRGLVAGQVALALVLLTGLALAGRGFVALVSTDPGFDVDGALTLTLELPGGTEDTAPAVAFYRALEERLGALPGVSAAGLSSGLPLEGPVWSASFQLVDPDVESEGAEPGANMRAVSPGYLDAMGIRLVEGRGFDDGDRLGAGTPVVVVDQTVARRYWPGGSPVGRQVQVGALSADPATVIGVVGDVPDESLHAPGGGDLYFPLLQRPLRRTTAVLRTTGDPAAVAAAARGAIREADPRVPVFDVRTLDERLATQLSGPRLAVALLAGFGAMALVLAGLGVYGVLAHGVASRRREIGVRIALGARPVGVTRRVVAEGLLLWALGSLIGGVGALAAARPLARLLPAAAPPEPSAFVAAALLLGLAAAAGALLPARRAARLDPAETLRSDG